jgi:hypothetical protein
MSDADPGGSGPDSGFGPGSGPGINDSSLGASFRDLPGAQPRHFDWVAPVAAIGGAVIVLIALIFLDR